MIYNKYISGDGMYLMERTPQNSRFLQAYEDLHKKLDGSLTVDKARFIVDERNRLRDIINDDTYSKEYQQDTYTGYFYADYGMITQHFYQPMEYVAMYETNIKQVVKKAKDNIGFYEKSKNDYERDRNEYIVNHYSGRKINVFYDGKPWESLLEYDFSDLLILFLIILGVVPIFISEKQNGMEELILSSKNGKSDMILAKVVSVILYIAFVVIVFSSMDFIVFKLLYGLSGGDMPVYALESYKYTPLNHSVSLFYIMISLLKVVGGIVFGFWLCIFSTLFQRVVYPYMLGVLMAVGGIYISGYLASVETVRIVLALMSPFTLLKGNELFIELSGLNISNSFFLRGYVCLFVQLIVLGALYCLIYLLKCKGNVRRKKRFFLGGGTLKCCFSSGERH